MFEPLTTGTVQVIGHRGARAYAPDNTTAAFRLAAEHGADGVELDARRTSDGSIIVHHDDRATGTGPWVAMSLAEVRRIDPAVPTLDEALEACEGMWVNVEIKNAPHEADWDISDMVALKVAGWVRANDLYDRVIVSSFNPATILTVKAADTAIATGQLTAKPVDAVGAVATVSEAGHDAIHPSLDQVTRHADSIVVEAATAAGLAVVVWTVNADDDVRRLAAAGVAGIITDDPLKVRAALEG